MNALRAHRVLDTPREQSFDDVTRLAARICEAPVALISFVDEHRQWFKSTMGVDLCETPLNQSICATAMREDGVFVVPDVSADPRFSASELVTGDFHLRFYAGAPLVSAEGAMLGALCVLDTTPRPEGLTPDQADSLLALARQVMAQIALTRRTAELAESERRFSAIANAMPQMVWSTRPDGFHDFYNDRWYEFTGVPYGSTDGEGWNGMFHPDDQDRAWARWRHSLATGEPYEIEYRLRHRSGQYRWTLGRALPIRNEKGEIERWFGTCTDIQDIKANEEARELLTRELSHRIKNIFAVVGSLIALSARGQTDAAAYAAALRERVEALSVAHDYVRSHAPTTLSEGGAEQTAKGLLTLLLQAYRDENGARVVIAGEDCPLGDRAATALSLIFHEQATNAVKYGALSTPSGRVKLTGRIQGASYELVWREIGGPPIAEAPSRKGFGSLLAQRSAIGQLGGEISHDWSRDGLIVRLVAPVERLAR